MNIAQRVIIGVAVTVTLATTVVLTEGSTKLCTNSINPHNLLTYLQFKSFCNDFDNRNQESFHEVSEFVANNGHGILIATVSNNNNVLHKTTHYRYKYFKPTDPSLPKKLDSTFLVNWDAVRKYMRIENDKAEAAQQNITCYSVDNW